MPPSILARSQARHRRSLGWAAGLGFSALSSVAAADGSGLQIRHILSPEPGKVAAIVEPDGSVPGLSARAPQSTDFALLLSGGQPAVNVTVRKNSDRGGLLTLVVLDDSGSYRTKPGVTLARPLLQGYASALGPGDRIGLIRFGADAEACDIRGSASDFLADLASPKCGAGAGTKNNKNTNLLAGLNAAMAILRKEQEEKRAQPGLSEIILLSDAGDEANVDTADWRSLLATAEARGVRMTSVISELGSGGGPQRLATLTRLRELADKTNGLYDNSSNLTTALDALRTSRDKQKDWLAVEAGLCGIKADATGNATVDARVEFTPGGARKAWSASRPFKPQWTPASEAPCPNTASCAVPCAQWEQCTAGKCEPKSCTANELCGPKARCFAGRCERMPDREPYWLWALLGGFLVLAGATTAALLLRRRRSQSQPVVDPPAPPKPPEAAPVIAPPVAVAPPVGGLVASPLLDPLPETHLVAIGGRVTIGEKWRLHKAKVSVGGSSAPEDQNDIVFSIPQMSSKHALFELYPSGALWITDLKARNGTYVNGRRLEPGERVQLKAGDQVKLSQQLILEVQRPGETPAKEPEAPAAPAPAAEKPVAAAEKPKGEAGRDQPLSNADKKKTVFDPGNR